MNNRRKSIRLQGYDYSQEGCYFITICTKDREPIFGSIINDRMELSEFGRVIEFTWQDLVNHNPDIGLGEFIIMPNHVHGIIQIYEPMQSDPVGAGSKPAPDFKSIMERAGRRTRPYGIQKCSIVRDRAAI